MEHELPENSRGRIWWLASYPKSGSTWMRMFINCAVTRFPVDINSAYQYAVSDHVTQLYPHTAAMPIEEMDTRELIYYRLAALLNHLHLFPGRDTCMKTHHANLTLDDIPLCPVKLSMKALYIVRDPRDVLVSFAKHMGLTIDGAIEMMNAPNTMIRGRQKSMHYVSSWSNHVKSWIGEDNPIPTRYVRYEDMISDPGKTFRDAMWAIGLDMLPDESIEFAFEQTEFSKLKEQENRRGFRETGGKQDTFFNHGKVGRWKEVLTDSQVESVETSHGETMRELGYEPSLVSV